MGIIAALSDCPGIVAKSRHWVNVESIFPQDEDELDTDSCIYVPLNFVDFHLEIYPQGVYKKVSPIEETKA
jgi:hypothetical protein